jgi:UDP-arabinose 4-epimerase
VRTILVTGGAGFVGSHACKALSHAGYLPVTFDSLEHGHERAVEWGPLERGDLRNENDLARVFETHSPWAVIHFAAYAYVGESVIDPAKYYDNNVGGSAKLLRACAAFGCSNIVFSSSCATYGIPERLPLREDAPQNPVNPYGYTKLVVERMLEEVDAANCISPRPTSFRWSCSRLWGASHRSRSLATIIPLPMAPASETTCM